MTTKVRGLVCKIGTTAADPSGDTFVEIGGAKVLNAQIGAEYSEIDATTLTDLFRQVVKGVANAGTIEIGGNYDATDAGQADLKAAADEPDDDTPYNLQFVDANRTATVKARVFSFRKTYGTNANLVEFRSKLVLTAAYTEADTA